MQQKKKLGILMLDTTFERIPGDVGNPESYPFEIVKKVTKEQKQIRQLVVQICWLPFLAGAKWSWNRLG